MLPLAYSATFFSFSRSSFIFIPEMTSDDIPGGKGAHISQSTFLVLNVNIPFFCYVYFKYQIYIHDTVHYIYSYTCLPTSLLCV
jgi:hypothetical protein